MKTAYLIAAIAVVGLGLGLGYSLYEKQADPASKDTPKALESLNHLPRFSYPDLQGNMRSSEEWSDKIVVLNYWATWCPPCKKEIPDFIKTQTKYARNVQFVGIAIDDKQPVQEFADKFGINYPTLLGDMNAIAISKQLGNRFSGLPFTAIFDSQGRLYHQQTGEMDSTDLETHLKALLQL